MARDDEALSWLWERFSQRKGYVVDVGASDGSPEQGSLSHRLLTEARWSGLMVEPLPVYYDRLHQYYLDRPDVVCLKLAASDREGMGDLFPFKTVSTLEPTWAQRCAAHWGFVRYGEPLSVRLATLFSLLAMAKAPRKIDLLKVDTEGHDLKVLRGMDWNRNPEVVIVETLDFNSPAVEGRWKPSGEVVDYLEGQGYHLVLLTKGPNAIFERIV